MIAINLMLVIMFINSVILLSGVKMMFNDRYLQIPSSIIPIYLVISSLIEGYKLGEIGISMIIITSAIFLLILIWGYRRNKYIYSIHNVKQEDVINIIEKYLERQNIKYEINDDEIYLSDTDKSIFVSGFMAVSLDCREIKNLKIYMELVEEVRVGVKKIKQRYFPWEGVYNLIFVGFFYWIKVSFLDHFLK